MWINILAESVDVPKSFHSYMDNQAKLKLGRYKAKINHIEACLTIVKAGYGNAEQYKCIISLTLDETIRIDKSETAPLLKDAFDGALHSAFLAINRIMLVT